MDDLNALIAHAHRRIDQLNTELAEQRVREQIHIETALEQQKQEHQKALEKAVGTTLQHAKEESRLEHEGKVCWMKAILGFLDYRSCKATNIFTVLYNIHTIHGCLDQDRLLLEPLFKLFFILHHSPYCILQICVCV